MARATTTIIQRLNYAHQHAAFFAANQALFNQVVAFYFEVIQAHEKILTLKTKEALTALECLTHATEKNPNPIMPLSAIRADLPAMFRRAAINAALGSAKSFSGNLKRWRTRKEKAEAKGKQFTDRPPVPPRTWNKSVPFYAGVWRERTDSSILLKVWTGACWSWVKVRISGRDLPEGYEIGSPQLIRHGKEWWLHTPIEKVFDAPAKVEEQVKGNPQTKICAVDLNLGEQIAVCTIQSAEGTTLATKFMGGGDAVSGFRKRALGHIARNRSKTGIIAEGEQDNTALWQKIRHRDDDEAHRISRRIVQFAVKHGASIIAFEHLGNLRPQKGKYSRRGNQKRAYWMKGRIFRYAKYKAWQHQIITSRVNPRNTSRECAHCGASVIRYAQGCVSHSDEQRRSTSSLRLSSSEKSHPQTGYTVGAPLVLCPTCQMRGHADRNASLKIGQRLIARYTQPQKEKPPARRVRSLHSGGTAAGRVSQETGVVISQDAQNGKRPSTSLIPNPNAPTELAFGSGVRKGSISSVRHGDRNGHGTAQMETLWMEERPSSLPTQLRLFNE